MPSLHLTNLVVSVPALLPLVTHLLPSSPSPFAPFPSFLPSPLPWLQHWLPVTSGRQVCPDPHAFETPLWSWGCALGMWSCWEALAQSSHLSLVASKKRWGETGPAGEGDEASPLLPQLESLEMLWIQKKQLEVNGSHKSKGNLWTSGLKLQMWGWSLLQEPPGHFQVLLDVRKDACEAGMLQAALPAAWRCNPHGSPLKQKCPGCSPHHSAP